MQKWAKSVRIDSLGEARARIQPVINELMTLFKLNIEDCFAIRLVLSELVQNAFIHGKQPIEVFAAICKGRLVLLVRDGGDGIRPMQKETCVLDDRGRGLKIVKSLSEFAHFHETKSEALVRIKLPERAKANG